MIQLCIFCTEAQQVKLRVPEDWSDMCKIYCKRSISRLNYIGCLHASFQGPWLSTPGLSLHGHCSVYAESAVLGYCTVSDRVCRHKYSKPAFFWSVLEGQGAELIPQLRLARPLYAFSQSDVSANTARYSQLFINYQWNLA